MAKRSPSNAWLEHCTRSDLRLDERIPVSGSVGRYPRRCPLACDMHYGFELGVVLRGRVLREYRDYQLRAGPGEVWLCGLWEPHTGRVIASPCEVVVWVIWPPMLAGLRLEEAPATRWSAPFTVPPQRRPRTASSDRPAMREVAQRYAAVLRQPDSVERRIRSRLLLMEALLLLRRGWDEVGDGSEARPDDCAQVNRAVRMVLETRRAIGTDEAARACATSRSHFDRLFTQQMGLTFARFELRHRLHGVARDLLGSDEPLKAIAAGWGFTDASHLVRRFGEYYGCAPGAYRRSKATRKA